MMPELRPEAIELVEKVKTFIKDEVKPQEHVFHEQIVEGEDRWKTYPKVIDELKDKARSAGLWNLFLPESEFGAVLTKPSLVPRNTLIPAPTPNEGLTFEI